jgi:hypothetical protein
MENPQNEPLYLICEDDAYRIEGLISTLAMAVWEILRRGEIRPQPPEDDDAAIFQNAFTEETRRILDRNEL